MKKQLFNFITVISLCSLLLVPCSSFAQIPNYVPTNGLVGWWPFNGNANDESGNGNNGTVNGATLTADRFGNTNKAYSFNGVSNYIEIADNSTLDIPNVSVSAWFWAIDYGTPPQQSQGHIVSKREQPGWGAGFQMALDRTTPANGIWANYTIGTNGWVSYLSNAVFTTQNWIHVVYTHDNSSAKLYINGNFVSVTNISGGLSSNNLPLWFGARPNAGVNSAFLNGKLDDIGIWNRALTACEIKDLYNAQLGTSSTTTATACSTYAWNGNTYNQSGQYTYSTTNANGCDSTAVLNLTINNTSSSTQTQTALDAYTWPVNGQTYTQSGTYTDTLTNATGCDSIVTLNLTLNYTGIQELNPTANKTLVKITDLNGKETPFRKNTVLLFIYDDGTVERVYITE